MLEKVSEIIKIPRGAVKTAKLFRKYASTRRINGSSKHNFVCARIEI